MEHAVRELDYQWPETASSFTRIMTTRAQAQLKMGPTASLNLKYILSNANIFMVSICFFTILLLNEREELSKEAFRTLALLSICPLSTTNWF